MAGVVPESLTTEPKFDEQKLRWRYRWRVAVFALCAVLTVIVLGTVYGGIQTLTRLEAVEHSRAAVTTALARQERAAAGF